MKRYGVIIVNGHIMPHGTEVSTILNTMIWVFLVASTICDAKTYKIPNQLIGLGYITGTMFNIQNYGLRGIIVFFINAVVPIFLLLLIYYAKGLGAGDIKLLSVLSSMVGIEQSMKVFFVSIIVASVILILLYIKEKHIYDKNLHYSYYISAAFFFLQLRGR